MRTQRETDLEDEIELLSEQLLSSYARIDELESHCEGLENADKVRRERILEIESLLKGDDL